MYSVVEGMVALAKELDVIFRANAAVEEIVENGNAVGVMVLEKNISRYGGCVDYHHSETLLPQKYCAYSEAYWDKKTFAPLPYCFLLV